MIDRLSRLLSWVLAIAPILVVITVVRGIAYLDDEPERSVILFADAALVIVLLLRFAIRLRHSRARSESVDTPPLLGDLHERGSK
jgi:hypothetical protein